MIFSTSVLGLSQNEQQTSLGFFMLAVPGGRGTRAWTPWVSLAGLVHGRPELVPGGMVTVPQDLRAA